MEVNATLRITKSASPTGYDEIGDVITYTIVVTNTGSVNLTNITVTDPLTGLNRTIPNLGLGESETIITTYTVDQDDLNAGEVENTATATFIFGGVRHREEDQATVFGSQGPDLSISKSADESSYSATGEVIHYSVVVTNTGNVTLTNIAVTDPLTGLNQTINSLAPGAGRTINFTYRIVQDDLNRGYVNNTATAAYTYGGTPHSESASVRITADIGPAISITKSAQERSYSLVGNTLHYNIIVRNTGNVTLDKYCSN